MEVLDKDVSERRKKLYRYLEEEISGQRRIKVLEMREG